MAERRVGIVMNGVTGRMGMNQHLIRSIAAIRADGGIKLGNGDRADAGPHPRRAQCGESRGAGPRAPHPPLYHGFGRSAGEQGRRVVLRCGDDAGARRAAAAGDRSGQARLLRETDCRYAGRCSRRRASARTRAGIKHGVVQDKLFLPGLRKLKMVIDSGFIGRILSVRGEFGYWVFEGDWQPAQRPSWNYKKAEGGGIILDMLCHWRYVLDNIFGACNPSRASARCISPSASTRRASVSGRCG